MHFHFYHDGHDFDNHLDRCIPGQPGLLPARPRWARRTVGVLLLGLLVLMHACG